MMKGFILGFTIGFAMGVSGTYLFMVGKRAEEMAENDGKTVPESKKQKSETPVILSKNNESNSSRVDYTKYSERKSMAKKDEVKSVVEEPLHNDIPEIIPPNEFGEKEGYDEITLTYFKDGVLVDDEGDPISNRDAAMLLGDDYMNHFGEYEDNLIHVRNDIREAYYEINKVDRDYAEYAKTKPRPVEIE